MRTLIRSVIASPKATLVSEGPDFDLSFITPQIAVCAGPVEGFVASLFRFSIDEVNSWLQSNFMDWHIWDLRSKHIDYSKPFKDSRITCHPFPDHEAPSMETLLSIVKELDDYLSEQGRLAVVHCNAGKGRSGTVVCAYLMYQFSRSGRHLAVDEAVQWFGCKRMRQFAGAGISIKSQLRLLQYWDKFLRSSRKERLEYFKYLSGAQRELYGIKLTDPCDGWLGDIFIQTYQGDKIVNLCKFSGNAYSPGIARPSHTAILPHSEVRVAVKWCCAWIQPYFEKKKEMVNGVPTHKVVLSWDDLDGFKGSAHKGIKLFTTLEVYWL